MDVLTQIKQYGEIEAWRQVPKLVAVRYKEASQIQQRISKVIKHLPKTDGYGHVWWNPESKTVWAVTSDTDTEQTAQRWYNSLKAIHGIVNVRVESEVNPQDTKGWIRIKSAAPLSWLNKPYEWAGALTGGPSPASNAIVSGLLGAGAGYGGGWLAEQFLPEDKFERGRLRRTLAIAGGLGGAATAIPGALANMSINKDSTGKSHPMRSTFMGDKHQYLSPAASNWYNFQSGRGNNLDKNKSQSLPATETNYERSGGGFIPGVLSGKEKWSWASMQHVCDQLPQPHPLLIKSVESFVKQASGSGFELRPIPVDAFNNAIWNDVHNGANSSMSNPFGTRSPYDDNLAPYRTPAVNAAAATGLVSGVQQMYGNPPLLHPKHFISGLANAGVDMVTARVAGGVLGVLGGLKPQAQQQLQNMGIWAGMIRGVTGSIFGLR